ncbi:MAG: sigma-E processing peptidase SpoIIGA [Clostridiaceae bacterium]|nr:sigma-E processing peptidase SpoIIGA [Clostridiaceae bacterium]
MNVYIDVMLLENFLVDLFLISITLKIIKINTSNKRVILSSLLGAIYTIVLVLNKLKFLDNIVVMILVAFIMMIIVVGKDRIKTALKATVAFIFSSIVLSGACFFIVVQTSNFTIGKGLEVDNFLLKDLILAIMFIFVVYERLIAYFKERSVISSFTYDVEITMNNVRYIVKGFLDTGNELREPITNLPCIIVESSIFSNVNIDEDKVYYMNYNAIGYSGKIRGFKVDKVRIREEGKEFKEVNTIICPCNEVLSNDGDYNALLSRGVI